jgi:2-iminoacetate synthase
LERKMSFIETFNKLPEERSRLLERMEKWLEPKSPSELESMAVRSSQMTREKFGRTMRLFAPLYLSNECVNNCSYCGFSRDNPILRVTLTVDQVVKEAIHLKDQGFRSILLVAGEHPKFVSDNYLEECLVALREAVPSLALEVGPMETPEYARMVRCGAEALIVYQETYNREAYAEYHTSGPKRNFDWRLECPERAYDGGFRRIGIGVLFGLAPWREEAFALAAHLEYLQRNCRKTSYTVAFPRLRPAAGDFQPRYGLPDIAFVQLICAFRICFPAVGIVLSTRESESLRDSILPLGITMMSAGSHTEPGGYTGQGRDDLHLTVKGRRKELETHSNTDEATGQFEISDKRTPSEVATLLLSKGFDPVWKDPENSLPASIDI